MPAVLARAVPSPQALAKSMAVAAGRRRATAVAAVADGDVSTSIKAGEGASPVAEDGGDDLGQQQQRGGHAKTA